ncbi:Fe-S protein assembly co-chaperone HscB [Thiobacillus sp.]
MDFSQTYFELFGLPQSYALDRNKLDTAYRELQNTVHPDRFASRPEADQRVAMQWATQVNEAYQTLKHSVSRGVYLLKLQGIDAFDAGNTKMVAAFLVQQIEWREALDEARIAKRIETLDTLSDDLRTEHRRIETQLAELIDSAHDFEMACEAVRQLRFMDKLIAEVGDAYEELES